MERPWRSSALGVLVCAVLLACSPAPKLEQLARGEAGHVAQVRSGDVLVLDSGLVVRLAGLEAPGRDEPGAEAATAALRALASGHEVTLFYGGARRDAYGRALAHVRRKDGRLWLQGAMLEAGEARVRTYSDNRALIGPMLAAEARARLAGHGLWTDPTWRVRLAEEAAVGFQLVEGRVARSAPAHEDLALTFSRGRLTAVIPRHAWRDFDSAGAAPAGLVGKLVRIRGYVGPDLRMRLDHPETVEILGERH